MPTYTYLCEQCQARFEAFASIQKKESGWKPVCPRCGSPQVRQTFESVGLISLSHSSAAESGSGCACSLHRD